MEGLDQLLERDEAVATCTISLLLDGAGSQVALAGSVTNLSGKE